MHSKSLIKTYVLLSGCLSGHEFVLMTGLPIAQSCLNSKYILARHLLVGNIYINVVKFY